MKIPDPWAFVLLSLAVYRVSRLIVADSFPPVAKLRKWFKYHWPDAGDQVHRRPKRGFSQPISPQGTDPADVELWRVIEGTTLGYLVSCMYCLPFWVAAVAWLSWNWFPTVTLFLATPFALAAVATLLHRWERRQS